MTIELSTPGPAMARPGAPIGLAEAAEAERRRTGHVVVPLLDAAEVEDIRRGCEQIHPPEDDGMTIGHALEDRRLMEQTQTLLAPMWAEKLPTLLRGYQHVASTILVKHPGPRSAMPMHLDPSVALHREGTPFNVWIPLVDVTLDAANGVVELVPGTELLPTSAVVGYDKPHSWLPYEAVFAERARPVEVPAGSALVFDSRVLHRSRPNLSGHPRMAIGGMTIPASSQTVTIVARGRRRCDVYAADSSFYVGFAPQTALAHVDRALPLLEQIQVQPRLSPADVAAALGLDEEPVRDLVVPGDVSSSPVTGRLPTRARSGRSPDADIAIAPAALVGAPPPEPDRLEVLQGDVHHWALTRSWASSVPSDLADHLDAVPLPSETSTSAVVCLEAGARARFGAGASCGVTTLDAPDVNAGIVAAGDGCELVPGEVVELDGSAGAVVWNDGPSLVWLVVERSRAGGSAEQVS